jgi:hypothetical protein
MLAAILRCNHSAAATAISTCMTHLQGMRSSAYPSFLVHPFPRLSTTHCPSTRPPLRGHAWIATGRSQLVTNSKISFPALQLRGVIVIEDYGHRQGEREAVDEYFANNDVPVFLNGLTTPVASPDSNDET